MNNPPLSIIIPSFNQGKYIERTLLSILKQEYGGEIEVIVSDGGSTDNTVDVLKKYTKQIIWWSEKDSGYADAVNKGFAIATGDIFAIQSSDDYYLKDSFTKIISAFNKNPDAILICGREVLQEADGYIFGGYELPPIINPRGFLLEHSFPGIFQHTTFFRREFYEKVGGMRSDFDLCADADLFYRMLHFGNGYFLNEYIAVYQKHDSQRTKIQTIKFENQLLGMVLNCKNDSSYNKLYNISNEDYFWFNGFIHLFFLQYTNLEEAQNKAKEAIDSLSVDDRTRKLAQRINDSVEINKGIPIPGVVKNIGGKMKNLFKKYITNDNSHLPVEDKISFRELINPDWWQN
jgi:glycosyltransferase involved in cell wall biosynthesis